LTYGGVEHVPFGSLDHDAAAHAVMFVSASKGWNLPGLGAGLAITGSQAAAGVRQLPPEVQESAGLLGVIAAEAALSRGVAWLDHVVAALDTNRRLLADLLATHLPVVRYRMPDATYLAWLDCSDLALGDDPAAVFLERGRVALSPGHTFGTVGRGFVRLNLAASPQVLTEGVHRMVTATGR
jgi:cystathionine beta-lyase